MENLSPNCVQLFVRAKDTVFTMGGTVPFLSPIPIFRPVPNSVAGEKFTKSATAKTAVIGILFIRKAEAESVF